MKSGVIHFLLQQNSLLFVFYAGNIFLFKKNIVGNKEKNNTIDIHYEKNPSYRTINADGAVGGITPLNQINLSFYSTRNSIQRSIRHKVNDDGSLSETEIEISADSKSGIIREIEFGVYMNRQSAHDIYSFLKKIFEDDTK